MHAAPRFASLALLSLAVVACDTPSDFDDELVEDEVSERWYAIGGFGSGRRLNTNHAGKHWFSELDLTGDPHEDTMLLSVMHTDSYGVTLPVERDSIEVIGGALEANRSDGLRLHHTDFNSTIWRIRAFTLAGEFEYDLTVEAHYDASISMPLYTFYWDAGPLEGWLPTCDMPDEGPELTAMVYEDLNVDENSGDMWQESDLLYIGCMNGAVGKAARWDYDLGAFAWSADPIEMFEGAVRVVRADYCGDGVSHTRPGTPVFVEDKLGINSFWWWGTTEEAAWGTNGALCLDTPRLGISHPRPTCTNGRTVSTCGGGAAHVFLNDPSSWFFTAT